MPQQITIAVDSELAEIYRTASDQERRKLDLLINLYLRQAIKPGPKRSIFEIMDETSREAERRGLTPEILQSILDDKE